MMETVLHANFNQFPLPRQPSKYPLNREDFQSHRGRHFRTLGGGEETWGLQQEDKFTKLCLHSWKLFRVPPSPFIVHMARFCFKQKLGVQVSLFSPCHCRQNCGSMEKNSPVLGKEFLQITGLLHGGCCLRGYKRIVISCQPTQILKFLKGTHYIFMIYPGRGGGAGEPFDMGPFNFIPPNFLGAKMM